MEILTEFFKEENEFDNDEEEDDYDKDIEYDDQNLIVKKLI